MRAPVSLILAWLVAGSACRDEQAGPRPNASNRPPLQQARIHDSPPLDLSFRSGGTWANGAIAYAGAKVSSLQVKPKQPILLSHFFEVKSPPPAGFRFFEHLVDPQTGQMIVNADHPIPGGPIESWPVGKVIEDAQSLALPPGSPEKVMVVIGFWNDSGRLAVDPSSPALPEDRMIGPTLEVVGDQLPEYHVKKTAKPPVIDGALNDKAWALAQPVVLRGSLDGHMPDLRTTARLLYDDQYLYVSFDSEDPDVWGTMKNRDDPIYNEEVVEIFIDADGDGQTYNELEVSPNNTLFDAYFPARRQGMDTSWDSGAKTAVQVRGTLNDPTDRDEGWSVEMAIPIARLAAVPHVPPRRGDRWRFNLYRLEHVDRKRVEGQAFSPPYVGDFHHLARFGWLIFD